VFLEHVIGGDRLSTDPRLRSWVRAVTPDAVLEGVTMLARVLAPAGVPVVVVDVGAATTDVYCVPDPDAEQAALGGESVGVPARRRTVEGDLGVSWSADALRTAAAAEGAARARARSVGPGPVVLSAGVFRHADPAAVEQVISRVAADAGGAGSVVSGAPVVVDRRYVLAAIGLLATEHPEAATALAQHLLRSPDKVTPPAG
jgi:hypothetical protein